MADASGRWVRGAREQHGGRPRDHSAMALRRTSSLTSNELLVRKASKWINKRHAKAARRRRGEDDVSDTTRSSASGGGGGGGSGRGDDSDGGDDGEDDAGNGTDNTSDGGPDNGTPKASKLDDLNRWDDTEGEDDSSGDKTPEPGPTRRGRPAGGNRGREHEARGNRGTKGGSRSGTKKRRNDRSRSPSTSSSDELAGEETAPKRTRNAATRSTRAARGALGGNTGGKKPKKAEAVRRLKNEEEEEAERDRNVTVEKFRKIMESMGWRPDARVSSAAPRPPSGSEESTGEEETSGDEGAGGIPTSSDPSTDEETEKPPEDPEKEDDGDILAKMAIIRASLEDEDSDDSSDFDEDESDVKEESEDGYDEPDREFGEHNDEWWDNLGKVAQAYASEFTNPEYEWPSESIDAMGAVATMVEPSLSEVASTRRSSSSSGNTCDSKPSSNALPFLHWVRDMRDPHELESALDKAYRVENGNAKSRERRRATGETLSATPEPPMVGYTQAEYVSSLEGLSRAAKRGEYDFHRYEAEDIHNKHFPGNLGPNIPSGADVLSYPVGARTPDPKVYDPVNWEKHVDFDEISLRGSKASPSKEDIRIKDGAWMPWEETLKAYPRLDDIRRLDHAWEALAAIQPSENMSNEEMMDITAVTIKHWPAKAAHIGPGSRASEAVLFPLDANNTAWSRRRLPPLPVAPGPIKGLSIQGTPEPASRNWGYGGSANTPEIKIEDDLASRPLRPPPTEEELLNATPINNDIFPKMPLSPEKQKEEGELREQLREIRQREEAEARRRAEEDARRQQEARRDAEEARRQAAVRQKAEEGEAARQAEEARKDAARRKAEETRRDAEEAQRQTQQTTGPNNSEDANERSARIAQIKAAMDNKAFTTASKLIGPFNMDEVADHYVAYREAIQKGREPETGTRLASDTGELPSLAEFKASLPPEERANEELAERKWYSLVFKATKPKPEPEPKTTAAGNDNALMSLFNMDEVADHYVAYRDAIRQGQEPEAGTKHGRDDEDGQAGGDSKRRRLASDTGPLPSLAEFKASLPPEERADEELAKRKWYSLVFKATKPKPEPKTPDHAPAPLPDSSSNAAAQTQETGRRTDLSSTENPLNDDDYTELLIQQTLLPGFSEATGDSGSHEAATATTAHDRQTGGADHIPGIDDDDEWWLSPNGDGDESKDEDEVEVGALLEKKNVQFDLGRNEEYDDDGGASGGGYSRGGGGAGYDDDDYYYRGRIPGGAERSPLSDGVNRAARRAIYNLDTDPWKPSFDSYWETRGGAKGSRAAAAGGKWREEGGQGD
ncbi:hypothetical protein DL769_010927 [Monosporascus sp. CRB-8-3]|nr:hypothetical protein DL769_010927 [Monosporascus sp. CRB-8-3]